VRKTIDISAQNIDIVHMNLSFDWDMEKAAANLKKHRVSFEEAVTVFASLPIEIFHDPDHSDDEERYIAVGFSEKARVLLVVHCENSTGTMIRIISARKATAAERRSLLGGAR